MDAEADLSLQNHTESQHSLSQARKDVVSSLNDQPAHLPIDASPAKAGSELGPMPTGSQSLIC